MKNFVKGALKFGALAIVVSVIANASNPIISNLLTIGDGTLGNKVIKFNRVGPGAAGNPQFRWNETGQVLEFSNDGVIFQGIPSALGAVPTGASIPFNGQVAPAGYALEDGTCYNRTGATAALFAVIGTTFGICDGMTQFAVPDSRGLVVRMPGGSSGLDPDIASRTDYNGGMFGTTFTVTGSTHNSTTVDGLDATDWANIAIGMFWSAGDISAYVVDKPSSGVVTISVSSSGANSNETITSTTSASGPYVGSYQGDQFGSHGHTLGLYGNSAVVTNFTASTNPLGRVGNASTDANGGNESRGKNTYKNFIIKL